MEPVLAIVTIAEAVWLVQRAVPRVPSAAVGLFDVQIDGDLADVVQQCGVGDGSGPGFGLRGLILGLAPMGSR